MERINTEMLQRGVDFIKLVGQYTTLTQHGQEWTGLCPFHEEHTASFGVTGDKWYCFGCGAKGAGAIRFVMDYHRLDFRPACEWLAQWTGTGLPVSGGSPALSPARQQRGDQAQELARWQSGCRWLPYQRGGDPAAQAGQEYLLGRGISPFWAVCSAVRYHPDWYGQPRIVFPIMGMPPDDIAAYGPLVALQGRAIAPDCEKRDRLRCAGMKSGGAFWTAAAWWQETIIFTEGEIEALTLAECGFPAVATCGADNKAAWMGTLCRKKRVVIAFDDDTSGEKGANTLAALLRQSGVTEIDAILPPGVFHPNGKAFDWNDCLCKYGREAVAQTLSEGLSERRRFGG
ncbi:MAG: CHC2 zinc finger domain-containing protein [Armatimonadota bacterium]